MQKNSLPKHIFFSLIYVSQILVANDLPLVAVTCMYNNEKWALKNLESIFNQKYNNFRVVIVDDCSTDNTVSIIKNYLNVSKNNKRTVLIENKNRRRKLANLYDVLYQIADDEIAILVDGDDWLADNSVFSYINSIYQKNDVWFTYGQYENIPAQEAIAWGFNPKGYAKAIPTETIKNRSYRKGPFYYMHPRTFKGWLFKLVKLEDLISTSVEGFIGDFFPASNDLAMYIPMVEMAHTKVRFIKKILYKRNLFSDLVGFKVDRTIQVNSGHEIKKRSPYTQIQYPISRNLTLHKNSSLKFIIETNNLDETIYSIKAQEYLDQKIDSFTIILNDKVDPKTVYILEKQYPKITIIYSKNPKNSAFKHIMSAETEYICYMNNTSQVINFDQLIYQLNKTYADIIILGEKHTCCPPKMKAQLTENLYAVKNCFLKEVLQPYTINGFILHQNNKKRITIFDDGITVTSLEAMNDHISLLYEL
ncbi:glycosyltransferase [bacterium]|nr:MAG: glycosyltransferase [bacterium]QQR62240.1 MAG: glycosyltransferase [bacterium]QQR63196.1 MAG: glycosyltransferase [bacterium]